MELPGWSPYSSGWGVGLNPYERFAQSRSIVGATSATLMTAVSEPIATRLGLDALGLLAVPAAQLGLALAVWTLLAVALMPALERLRFYRRLMLGRHYVEGIWVTVATPAHDSIVSERTMEILTIEASEECYRSTGVVYNLNGDAIAHFESKYSSVNWPIFSNQVVDVGNRFDRQSEGLAQLHFQGGARAPKTLSGYYGHVGVNDTHTLEGIKIENKKELEALLSHATRRERLAHYFKILIQD